jgi:signal transduction histidine kinase
MPGNVRGPKDMAQQLVVLLDEHREEIADAWLDAICTQMADSRYGQRPPDEIRTNNMVALAMLKDLLQGMPSPLGWERQADTKLALQYVDLGIEISEVTVAALLLEDVLDPILVSALPPDSPERHQVRLNLRRYVRVLTREIVQGYAEVAAQHLREQQKRTALMLEITRTTSRSLDLDTVLRQAAQDIAAAAGTEHCLIFLTGDDSQSGVLWAVTEELPPATAERLRRSLDRSLTLSGSVLIPSVVEGMQPLTCYDAQTDPRTDRELMTALGFRSVLEVPFVHRDHVLGVAIVVTFDGCRDFTDEQIELACGVASAVAPAIENARLYQQVEQMAVLEERARLAREIHDDVAQTLGALQLRMSLLEEMLAHDRVSQACALLSELQDVISEAYTGVRESVFGLRAMTSSRERFLPSLREYLADYQLHYNLDVVLDADVDAAALLDASTGVQVIRIIQEALTNARRHARASHAWVRIHRLEDQIQVIVEDDGRGFEPSIPLPQDRPHFGLQVMRERAEKVGGRLTVDSRPGQGARVELRLPCSPVGGQP